MQVLHVCRKEVVEYLTAVRHRAANQGGYSQTESEKPHIKTTNMSGDIHAQLSHFVCHLELPLQSLAHSLEMCRGPRRCHDQRASHTWTVLN